ncbi:MAG: hypothetical protein L3K14_09830 [Thermoplasmata archaeon]|nr:hypothetical protein [Thermoplasmata archaeon]
MASPGPKAADPTAGGSTEPIAVVWCRQVDNEAESPGYTALPNDFTGYQETLDAIRIVGNLAVNISDTQDYWDPDPALPLSYYRNLFLYPAYGGTYTCLGRMFLSTEDRPRLGMKTLVLDTARLLATPSFGETILRWYESMGGGRHDQRPPPPPDPKLYPLVGEGFLFYRGSTEPVLLIAADEWEATMETIFDYVRALPASLLTLGAILAFPYFLPEPKTNLAEFAEATPLALATLRVPRGESTGERHRKRVQSWEEAPFTLYDLTAGIPAPAGKGKEVVPLIVQYVRDHASAKLSPVTERVDRVELRTLRARLADPDRQGGKDRRKEMWRLATAMESTALLLQRPRGRRLELSPELSRRAQEYLRAHAGEEPTEEIRPADLPPSAPAFVPDAQVAGQLPPWLQRGSAPPPALQRASKVEVIPMSVKDDPSLLKVAEPTAGAAAATAGGGALRRQVEADLMRYLDERLSNVNPVPPSTWTQALEDRLATRFNSAVERRLQELPAPVSATPLDPLRLDGVVQERLRPALADQAARQAEAVKEVRTALEQRFGAWTAVQQQALSSLTDRLLARTAELEARLGQDSSTRISQAEERVRADLRTIVNQELDRGVRSLVEPKLQDLKARSEETLRQSTLEIRAQLRDSLNQALTDVKQRAQASEENLRGALVAQLDLHLREAQDRDETQLKELEQKLRAAGESRITEAEQRRVKELQEIERRLSLLIDGRAREVQEKVSAALRETETRTAGQLDEQLGALEARGDRKVDSKLDELRESEMHSVADLQVRLQSYADQKLRESMDREREKVLELLARLKGETEASLAHALDAPTAERIAKDQFQRSTDTFKADIQQLIDLRAMAVEERFSREHADLTQRLEGLRTDVADRSRDNTRLEDAVRAELEELDRKIVVLTDRLVPVVRKAWTRLAEVERGSSSSAESDLKYAQLRREFTHDLRRIETDLAERTREIRERVEGTIANQGRVWLTLVRQLSQMTEERRAIEEARAPTVLTRPRANSPPDSVDRELASLSDLTRSGLGGEEAVEDAPEEPETNSRRRTRRPSGR